MAEVQANNNSSGIKLFGATITTPKQTSSQKTTNDHDNKQSDDQTVEKRPDKIIPCPRCKSMETKFCYFNNYNVNQPRHFCKGCQRYWTAGGALRNVPVGAGRRRTKPPCRELYDDATGVQQLSFDEVVEEWHVAEHGGYRHLFQAKRRRCSSSSQSFE